MCNTLNGVGIFVLVASLLISPADVLNSRHPSTHIKWISKPLAVGGTVLERDIIHLSF